MNKPNTKGSDEFGYITFFPSNIDKKDYEQNEEEDGNYSC